MFDFDESKKGKAKKKTVTTIVGIRPAYRLVFYHVVTIAQWQQFDIPEIETSIVFSYNFLE